MLQYHNKITFIDEHDIRIFDMSIAAASYTMLSEMTPL